MSSSNHVSEPLNQRAAGESTGEGGVEQSPFQVEKEGSQSDPIGAPDRGNALSARARQVSPSGSPFELVDESRMENEGNGGPGFPIHGFAAGPAALSPLEAVPSWRQHEAPAEAESAAPGESEDPFGELAPQQQNRASATHQAVPISAVRGDEQGDFSMPAAKSHPAECLSAGVTLAGQRDSLSAPLSDRTKQLELRAIFGVDHELSHQEIMQRMRDLPGIINIAEINSSEAKAFGALKSCALKLGLAREDPVFVRSARGVIDFVSYKGTTLGILLEGTYGPGVRETLYICTRELERLR